MAKQYTKNTWTDEVLADTEKYVVKNDAGETVYGNAEIALATQVVTAGTPVDAAKMNNIESGIDALDSLVAGNAVPVKASGLEIITGTNDTKFATAKAIKDAGIRPTRYAVIEIFAPDTEWSVGDGKKTIPIPPDVHGMNLVYTHACIPDQGAAGTTGTGSIQIRNVTDSVDMLSTKLTIDSGEVGSDTAATAYVIDTTKDDVAVNDRIAIDVDGVHTTPAKGLVVTLGFRMP